MPTIARIPSHELAVVVAKFLRPVTMLRAILSTPKVPYAVAAERVAACLECPLMRHNWRKDRCSICGCDIAKLSAYAERLPEWGCKHPERASGQGWAR